MTTQLHKGKAESSWPVARRCLAILLRLQQGPAQKQELLTAVQRSEGKEAYGHCSPKALDRRFREDLSRLEKYFGIKVAYSKADKGYVVVRRERPLLNLPDADLQTLAFLADTFQPDSPHAQDVQQFIDRLVDWLPAERQKVVRRAAGHQPTSDLRLRDSEPIAADVFEAIQEAWQARQEVQFDYLSPNYEDGIPRQHRVQPWDLYFSDRGHLRLRAYCLFSEAADGSHYYHDYINLRLSRIVPGSVEILSRKLPATRPHGRLRDVIIELSPTITRFGVSQRKELLGEMKVRPLDEGWIRIEGQTHDVFELARNLLYYGAHCRVLGGKELLDEMRTLVKGLVKTYQYDPGSIEQQ
ncbi:MAG: WYL domain-containing protein [Anaerolineae bacterium]|nr:WYL domain-containing protein [Anaerolineae bacterium]